MRRSLSPVVVSLAMPVRAVMVGAVSLALVVLWPTGVGAADGGNEARLRDALRSAITQTRSMEDELARLRAKAAEDGKIIETLKAQAAAGGAGKPARAAPDTAILERMEAEFNRRLAAQNEGLAKAAEALDKWKAAYQEAAGIARTKEGERAQLAGQTVQLLQRAESCEVKNLALFTVGNEILDRYAGQDIAETLVAKEPFLGFKRVELQNLVQEYQDKLLDQKVSDQAISGQAVSQRENAP